MLPMIQVSNKRKSTPDHNIAEKSPRIKKDILIPAVKRRRNHPMPDPGFHKEEKQPQLLQFWLKS